jgi:hypothetical protein
MPATDFGLQYRELRLPRQGGRPDECEDASAAAPERGRFALADGASESFYAGLWAALLVEAFVRSDEPQPDWRDWLPPVQADWAERAGLLTSPGENGSALPWYLESRMRQGAFATFLGLVVEGPAWHAVAVGDTCLFQVRCDRLEVAFPLTRVADFHSTPWLIGSRQPPAGVPLRQGVRLEGEGRGGDRFYLLTDALAQWFLTGHEAGGAPWRVLDELLARPREAFVGWVTEQRGAGRLRDDDVTLMAVCL